MSAMLNSFKAKRRAAAARRGVAWPCRRAGCPGKKLLPAPLFPRAGRGGARRTTDTCAVTLKHTPDVTLVEASVYTGTLGRKKGRRKERKDDENERQHLITLTVQEKVKGSWMWAVGGDCASVKEDGPSTMDVSSP